MDERISNFAQRASVRRYTLTEGVGKGLDIIDCDNGKLRFLVNVSKACDIMQLYHGGQNVSFISKNGFKAKSDGFINRFEGGMVYTCGLDSIGDRNGYAMHGTIHNTPAEIICASCDENGITIESIVRDTELFGKDLVLKRKITSQIYSDSITLEDTLINEGYKNEDYCVLYHINIGYPFLDDGAEIISEISSCTARTEWAKDNECDMLRISKPIVGMQETCYFLKMKRPIITLVNKKIGKSFTVEYSHDTLPCFVEWKSMASGDYALGLEPSTTELDEKFELKTIRSGEKIGFSIKLTIK